MSFLVSTGSTPLCLIDCRTLLVKFKFPNESVIECKRSSTMPEGCFISYLKTSNLVFKGCVYHLVRVNDYTVEIPLIQLVHIVREFIEVF